MSLNLEMLQVARLSPKLLGDSADLVADFLHSLINDDGGFVGRGGKSDLYYTAFGIGGLLALRKPLPLPALRKYLEPFGDGGELDFVHLACLARCWSSFPQAERIRLPVERMLERVEAHRTADGGYAGVPGAAEGTIYGCFLGLGAYQDLGRQPPQMAAMGGCIEQLRCADGGYANGKDMPIGLTPPTAGAAALLRQLDLPRDAALGDWLLARFAPEGGFCVAAESPLPDLLSTATALHALADLKVEIGPLKERCLDFLDTLWTARGGFHGNWEDDALDCEYTYYGLLSLGHLSLV